MSLKPLWERGDFVLQKCGVLCLPRRRCVREKFKIMEALVSDICC